MKQEVQYAARFPASMDPTDMEWGHKWETRQRECKEDAEKLVHFLNGRARDAGFPERAYVAERVVMVGEWEPVGASEPHLLRGGIEE